MHRGFSSNRFHLTDGSALNGMVKSKVCNHAYGAVLNCAHVHLHLYHAIAMAQRPGMKPG